MVSAPEYRVGVPEAPEGGGGEQDELQRSEVQLQTQELLNDVGLPGGVARRAGRLRLRGLWGDWVGTDAGSRCLRSFHPAPLAASRWPRPCKSLRPTSCPLLSGLGSTSFAKLGSPRSWQEVPSRPTHPDPPSPASHGGHQRPLRHCGPRALPQPVPTPTLWAGKMKDASLTPLPGVGSSSHPTPTPPTHTGGDLLLPQVDPCLPISNSPTPPTLIPCESSLESASWRPRCWSDPQVPEEGLQCI